MTYQTRRLTNPLTLGVYGFPASERTTPATAHLHGTTRQPWDEEGSWQLTNAEHVGEDVD